MARRAAWFRHAPHLYRVVRRMNPAERMPRHASLHGDAAEPTRVAVAQMTSTSSKEGNLKTISDLVEQAAAERCRVLFLPECFAYIGEKPTDAVEQAQAITGPLMQKYQELAKKWKVWLNLGGFHEVGNAPGKIFNTQLLLDDGGEIVSTYRKVHLFDVNVPNGPVLMESKTTTPGEQLVTCDTPAGKMGLTTCYDVRFPLMYQILRHKHNVQLLTVPSAFTKVTGAAHWEVLLRARAIETQCYVVASAQAGKHNAKRESYGHSMVVNPWGEVVAKLDDPTATGIATCTIDLESLRSIRERMPVHLHRKTGLYEQWENLA
eukprot:scaffold1372_cov351-Pavlova_lutheri.AAC.10